ERLDAEAFHALCLQAFREMRAAGITSLGEFHYFRHGKEREDFACDELVLDAAQEAGLRLVLLAPHQRTRGTGPRPSRGPRRLPPPATGSRGTAWPAGSARLSRASGRWSTASARRASKISLRSTRRQSGGGSSSTCTSRSSGRRSRTASPPTAGPRSPWSTSG